MQIIRPWDDTWVMFPKEATLTRMKNGPQLPAKLLNPKLTVINCITLFPYSTVLQSIIVVFDFRRFILRAHIELFGYYHIASHLKVLMSIRLFWRTISCQWKQRIAMCLWIYFQEIIYSWMKHLFLRKGYFKFFFLLICLLFSYNKFFLWNFLAFLRTLCSVALFSAWCCIMSYW